MQGNSSNRRGFTLSELVVLIVILGAFQGVVATGVDSAREAARRTQCSNNLRQLGIAVHNYADVNAEQFVPLSSDWAHWSWHYYLLPFMEASTTYDKIRHDWWAGSSTPNGLDPSDAEVSNASTAGEFRASFLLCPSRRTRSDLKAWWVKQPAQATDYAAVVTGSRASLGEEANGCIIWRAQSPDFTVGRPLRSRTTIGSCIDGLSNTAIIGEKYLRPKQLDDPAYEQAALVGGAGGYLRLFHGRVLGGIDPPYDALAGFGRGLPYKQDQAAGGDLKNPSFALVDDWSFGSWHSKICLFVMGDASIRPVNDRTNPRILSLFGGRNDRQVFELPAETKYPRTKTSDLPQTFSAKGTLVLAEGELPPGLTVVLVPMGGDGRHVSQGAVDKDGSFSLSTFKAGDGAPEGEYQVLVHFDPLAVTADLKEPKPGDDENAAPPADEIASGAIFAKPGPVAKKYASAKTTPLRIAISSDDAKNVFSLELEGDASAERK